MLCAVYTVYIEITSVSFLVEPQNQVDGLSVVCPQTTRMVYQ
jgi:hypothetical protein